MKINFYYPYRKNKCTLLYNIFQGKQFDWTKLINDIDYGTLDRWQGLLVDDRLIFHLMPITILKRLENMTESEKQNPASSRFVEMASKLSPNSNPVIMVCKL